MAGEFDIKVRQGDDKTITMTLSEPDGDIDLTNFDAKLQVRDDPKSNTIRDELSTSNDRIEIITDEVEDDKIILKFPNNVTKKYNFQYAEYDLKLITQSTPPVITTLLKGKFIVTPRITKNDN